MTDTVDPPVVDTKPAKPAKRSLLMRLFGIKVWGAIKLTIICIFVGFIVLASQFDPRDPQVDVAAATWNIAQQAWSAAGWAAVNFWKPAATGATVVLPIWLLWRLVSLPFRK